MVEVGVDQPQRHNVDFEFLGQFFAAGHAGAEAGAYKQHIAEKQRVAAFKRKDVRQGAQAEAVLTKPVAVVNALRLPLREAEVGQQDGAVAHYTLVGRKNHVRHIGLLVNNVNLNLEGFQHFDQLFPLLQCQAGIDRVRLKSLKIKVDV